MKNQSVSDFVAASMNAVLNSKEHKSLFDVQYKYAQDMNDAKKGKCSDCDKSKEDCKCDSSHADDDDNDARKAKKDEDSSDAWDNDDNDARKKKDEDSSDADDDEDTEKDTEKSDFHGASDGLETSVAYDVAIDSLLTASAALDSVGLGRGSAFSLKLASLVVEAKKKDKDSKKDKKKDSQSAKDKKSDKKSDKKDSQSAKDKKSDSKKSDKKDSQSAKFPFKKKDDKKSDSKDSKKTNPFAKKK